MPWSKLAALAVAAALAGWGGGGLAKPRTHHTYALTPVENTGFYINSAGHSVHRPAHAGARPASASARCYDGSYSFSESRRGTCSHHGGVAAWY